MIELMEELGAALSAGESIDDIMPLDLSGYSEANRIELLSIYITYGSDPDRVEVCKEKLKEMYRYAGR